ncbi:MAG: FKBP-type peptidyl-prolyl cis-trans isomerase, partial [Chitinophagaceae bacterium]
MKKIWIAGLVLFSLSATAQKKAAPKKTTSSKTAVGPLKNGTDSLSYALGVSVASFYKQQGIKDLNTTVISKAIGDVLGGKKPALDEAQCQSIIMTRMQKVEDEKQKLQAQSAKPTIEAGQKFLEQNKTRAGVKTTGSGLQYEVITQGTGPKPAATETV